MTDGPFPDVGRPMRRGGPRDRLHLEHLENRLVLAAGILFDSRSGVLSIEGTPRNDVATIALAGSRIIATLQAPGLSVTRSFLAAAVRRIDFSALAGDDSFTNATHVATIVDGGFGDDSLTGGDGVDRLSGGGGKDRLFGRGGNDVLKGGSGDDRIEGGTGADSLDGEDGIDALYGGDGNDVVRGGNGGDLLDGGGGDDALSGGTGDDQIYGGAGNDRIVGDDGEDKLWGGDGNDTIDGNAGIDTIDGDAGNDLLRGGDAVDHMLGGDGDDWMSGGAGNDIVDGEAGNDRLFGDGGEDRVDGGAGNDVLSGGDGDDEVMGNFGDDLLSGDAGDDWLDGNQGRDTIRGNAGNDDCFDDDPLVDESAEDAGDNLPARGGRDVYPMPLFFDEAGGAFAWGTSANRRDRSRFDFLAPLGGDFLLTVYAHGAEGNARGRYAEAEIEEGDGPPLLSVRPLGDGSSSGRVTLVAGRPYQLWVRSQTMDPVDFIIELRPA
ncbi:MAG: calcium-binding protein [Planctomycetaceae bacterium]